MEIFNTETASDFCECVENLLQTTVQTSFVYTGEFIGKDGVAYDVAVSYIKREEK